MLLHQFHELPVASGGASRLIGEIEKVHDVLSRRTAVTPAVRDKKNIALLEKERRQFGKPARTALAAVVPEDGGKGSLALWFVKEAVKNEAAAGKSDLDGGGRRLGGRGRRERDEENDQD